LRQSTTVDGKNNPANRLLIAIPAKADIAPLQPGHDVVLEKSAAPSDRTLSLEPPAHLHRAVAESSPLERPIKGVIRRHDPSLNPQSKGVDNDGKTHPRWLSRGYAVPHSSRRGKGDRVSQKGFWG
jgi:hypothetical protein